jgi:uncharacterized protein involved in outer membrane biogenesis
MPRFIRHLITSISISAVVALLSLVATITLIDPNDFKAILRQEIFARTGRNFTITGNLRWCLKPNLSLELNDVKMSNALTFAHDFLTIKKLRAIPKFKDFFKGHLLIDLEAYDVTLNLEDREQNNNWADLQNSLSSRILFNTIKIDNAELNYKNSKMDERMVLQNTRLHIQNISKMREASYVPFQIAGQWRAKDKRFIDVSMQGEWYYHPVRQQIDVQNIKLEASNNTKIPMIILGECRIETLFQNPIVSGKIQLSSFDLEKWWSILELKLPDPYPKLIALYHKANPSAAQFNQVKLQSAFRYQNTTLEIPHFQINVPNGSYFSGSFTCQPAEVSVTGNIVARQIQIAQLPCPELRFGFKANPSIIDVTQYEVQIAKNKHHGNLQIDLTDTLPKYTWINEIKHADLDEILFLLGFHHKLTGQLHLKTELKASGLSLEELKHNLSGTAALIVNQGQIHGINLLALLNHTDMTFKKLEESRAKGQPCNLGAILTAELLEWRQQSMSKDPLMTAFDSFEANFTIGNNMIKNDLLKINHAKFQLTGLGTLNLADNTLKFETNATLQSPTEASGTLVLQSNNAAPPSSDQHNTACRTTLPLSIMIQGPIDNVSIRPGLEQYAKQMLKIGGDTQKEDKKEDKKDDKEEQNPKALEKLFGFP